jgi:hypothetical protein
MEYEFWEVSAEITAQNPRWLDLSITLLECELRGVLPRD